MQCGSKKSPVRRLHYQYNNTSCCLCGGSFCCTLLIAGVDVACKFWSMWQVINIFRLSSISAGSQQISVDLLTYCTHSAHVWHWETGFHDRTDLVNLLA